MSAAADLREHYSQVRKRIVSAPFKPTPPQPFTKVIVVGAPRKFAEAVQIYPWPIGPVRKPVERDVMLVATPGVPFNRIETRTKDQITARRIVDEVCADFGVTLLEMASERRSKNIALARQAAMYRLKKETAWSLPRIGKYMGDRDHTTVLHACRKIARLIERGELLL